MQSDAENSLGYAKKLLLKIVEALMSFFLSTLSQAQQ